MILSLWNVTGCCICCCLLCCCCCCCCCCLGRYWDCCEVGRKRVEGVNGLSAFCCPEFARENFGVRGLKPGVCPIPEGVFKADRKPCPCPSICTSLLRYLLLWRSVVFLFARLALLPSKRELNDNPSPDLLSPTALSCCRPLAVTGLRTNLSWIPCPWAWPFGAWRLSSLSQESFLPVFHIPEDDEDDGKLGEDEVLNVPAEVDGRGILLGLSIESLSIADMVLCWKWVTFRISEYSNYLHYA